MKRGDLGPRPATRRAALAAGVVLFLALAGCSGTADDPGSGKGMEDGSGDTVTDRKTIERLSGHLSDLGRENVADIVRDEQEQTSITELDAPYLQDWTIYRIDYNGAAHEVQYIVGDSEDRALFFRTKPEAFAEMLADDGVEVDSAETAVAVARDYLYATRPTDFRSYLVESTDDITLREPVEKRERPRIESEYGDTVKPPKATESADGEFTVTAYVVYGMSLDRRVITFRDDGAIDDTTETLAEDVPVPLSL